MALRVKAKSKKGTLLESYDDNPTMLDEIIGMAKSIDFDLPSMEELKKMSASALTNLKRKIMGKSQGGSITKKRIGSNDFRKGGMVINTTDNRKIK